MSETIGKRVKRLREAQKLSQRRLGDLSETSGAYISQLEADTIPKPGVSQLQKIAAALGLPFADLITPASEIPSDVADSPPLIASDKYMHELGGWWGDLTDEDRELILSVARSVWEGRQARLESYARQKVKPKPDGV